MRKVIIAIVIVLILIAGGIAFLVMKPPAKTPESSEPRAKEPFGAKERSFYQGLAERHPRGEEYVALLMDALNDLQDPAEENDLDAILEMGTTLSLLGEKEEAFSWYQKALALDATNLLALNNAANVLDELGRYEESAATWLQLLEAYPERVPAWRSLGYLYRYRLNKTPSEIEAFFQTGLGAVDNHPDLLNWLISYFWEIGDNERFAKYANLLNAQSQSQ